MLPRGLIDVRIGEGERLVPAWLTARDEVWLRVVIEEIEAFDGVPVSHAEDRLREMVVPVARRHGVRARVVSAVWRIEQRSWKKRARASVRPERARAAAFTLGATRPRDEALRAASSELGVTEAALLEALFADRAKNLVLERTAPLATPADLARSYNLALAQALLMRSTELDITVHEHARRVVGYAKLRGLMATFAEDGNATRVGLSGPLALFRETTKYGRALAGLLPVLASSAAWCASARVRFDGRLWTLELDAASPIACDGTLPRPADSHAERHLARELRKLGSTWQIVREAEVVRVGARLFYPDFTLVSARGRVVVEIVGFWTPEYLAKKAEAIAAADRPILVCVDERHARGPFAESPHVLPYKRRPDAAALVRAAERLLASSATRLS
jgi:uncharacterized protein